MRNEIPAMKSWWLDGSSHATAEGGGRRFKNTLGTHLNKEGYQVYWRRTVQVFNKGPPRHKDPNSVPLCAGGYILYVHVLAVYTGVLSWRGGYELWRNFSSGK